MFSDRHFLRHTLDVCWNVRGTDFYHGMNMFNTRIYYGKILFSEIQLCGKRGVNREKKGGCPDVECLWMENVLNDESENIYLSQLLDIPTQQLILEEVYNTITGFHPLCRTVSYKIKKKIVIVKGDKKMDMEI